MSSRYFSSFLQIDEAVVFVVSTGSASPLCDSCFVLRSSVGNFLAGWLVQETVECSQSIAFDRGTHGLRGLSWSFTSVAAGTEVRDVSVSTGLTCNPSSTSVNESD